MFECTVRGITKSFETVQEMAEWRERMTSPIKKAKKPKKNKVKLSLGLNSKIKK